MVGKTVSLDTATFKDINQRNPLAVKTFRKFPGRPYRLDPDGFLDVHQLGEHKVDNVKQRHDDVIGYVSDVFDVSYLGDCLREDKRYLMDLGLRRSLFPQYGFKKLTTSDGVYTSPDLSLAILDELETCVGQEETELDKYIEWLDTKSEHYTAIYAAKNKLKPQSSIPLFATASLFCTDPPYFIATLDAIGVGMKHDDPEVRLITLKLLEAWVLSTRFALFRKPEDLQSFKNDCETVEDINMIRVALWEDGYGLDDEDGGVKDKAKELYETCNDVVKRIEQSLN